MQDSDWIYKEFSAADVGDKRLNERILHTSFFLAKQPGLSANKACTDWAAIKAAYRLFDNDKITPEKLLKPHINNTIDRASKYPFVLAIQDSSGINFTDHKAKHDFGMIGIGDPAPESQKAKGLYMHPTLAVAPNGLPLGILNNFFWKREVLDIEDFAEAPSEKESARWVKSVEQVTEASAGKINILTVSDRESDINELFLTHREVGAHFIVRSRKDRKIAETANGLYTFLKTQPISLSFEKEVQNKKGKNNRLVKKHLKGRFKNKDGKLSRVASLNIQFTQANIILHSGHRNRADIDFPITVIRVFETPREMEEGEYLVDWILLTSLRIENAEQAKLMVDFYTMRWRIEEFFKILKSGCRIEDSRYETYARTTRYIALNMVIAWRIFFMAHLNRIAPDEPCTSFLSESEWKSLYCKIKKTKQLPKHLPSVNECITWIAQLGGFIGRKCDGNPGNQSIWTGFKRLNDMAAMWDVLMST